MHGVNYIIDDSGAKTAVVINLKEWGDLWEDIHDIMESEKREKEEESYSWESVKE